MRAPFVKMHGCGNDFVIFDERSSSAPVEAWSVPAGQVPALADRRVGIGCDQLIEIQSSARADAFMRIWNPDGSEASACGNAARCVADLLLRRPGAHTVTVETVSGILSAERRSDGLIEVDMGPARLDWQDIPLSHPADTLRLPLPGEPAAAGMGNPHATFFVSDLNQTPVNELGPRFETDPLFPQRANVGFAQVLDPSTIRLKVWERGAGLTLACGSGACATVVNAHRRGLTHRTVDVIVDGGSLRITWRNDGHVLMAGPVATVFSGEVMLA